MEAAPTLLQSWLKHHAEYEAAGRKLAMVAGPGGNAGVITAGMFAAMAQTKSFLSGTTYVGSSVGAFNWLYMLIGPEYRAPTIFGQYYCDNRFFNPWKFLTRKPSLNLDYVLNEVTNHIIPLDYSSASQSKLNIQALTTNTEGRPHLLPLTGIPEADIRHTLRATSAMPFIARVNDAKSLSGWDGWLAEPYLLPQLHQQGITDVIWFLNRPHVGRMAQTEALLWSHLTRRMHKANPALAHLTHSRLMAPDFLQSPPPALQLEVIQPPVSLSAVNRNPIQIFNALGTSYRHMGAYLGHPHLPYPTEWAPWGHLMPH